MESSSISQAPETINSGTESSGNRIWTTSSSSSIRTNGEISNGGIKNVQLPSSNGDVQSASPNSHDQPSSAAEKSKTTGDFHEITDVIPSRWQKFFSWRFLMVLLLQTYMIICIFLRQCLPMALVCMVEPRKSPSDEQISNISYNNTTTKIKDSHFEFDWSSEVQGLVLTSIMFSTFSGPLIATILKEKLGSKRTLSISNLLATLLTFLSPTAARVSPYGLVTVRILLGICLGGNAAVIGDCVAWWAPQEEKLTMISLTYTGINVGSVLSSFLTGYLCLVPLDNGWPFVFYTFGAVSFLWGLCWHLFSSHKPEEHPFISEREKQFIVSHRLGLDSPAGKKKVKAPYRQLVTSVPVLAYVAVITCHMWPTQIITNYLPSYFNKRMKFTIQETGLFASLTAVFRLIGSFFWTTIGNILMGKLGTSISRKICVCLGLLMSGATCVSVGFFDDTQRWVVLGLLLFMMLNQAVRSSTLAAIPLDMAPRYAGLISGLTMTISSVVAMSGPLLTAVITHQGTQAEWQIVWAIMGCLLALGSLIFLPFGQASLQPWAQGKTEKKIQPPHVINNLVEFGAKFSLWVQKPVPDAKFQTTSSETVGNSRQHLTVRNLSIPTPTKMPVSSNNTEQQNNQNGAFSSFLQVSNGIVNMRDTFKFDQEGRFSGELPDAKSLVNTEETHVDDVRGDDESDDNFRITVKDVHQDHQLEVRLEQSPQTRLVDRSIGGGSLSLTQECLKQELDHRELSNVVSHPDSFVSVRL